MVGFGTRRTVVLLIVSRSLQLGSVSMGTLALPFALLPRGVAGAAAIPLGVAAVQGVLGGAGGAVTDRLGRPLPLVAGAALTAGAWAVAAGWGASSAVACASAAIAGAAGALFLPAATALMQQLVPAPRLLRRNAVLLLASSLTAFLAALLGGVLIALVGWAAALAAAAVLAALAGAGSLLLHRDPATGNLAPGRAGPRRGPSVPHGPALPRRWRWLLTGQLGILAAVATVAAATGPPAGYGVGTVGPIRSVVAATGVAAVAVILVLAPVRRPARLALLVGLGAVPVLLVGATAAPGWLLLAALGVASISHSVLDLLSETVLELHVSAAVIGRTAGLRLLGPGAVSVLALTARFSHHATPLVLGAAAVAVGSTGAILLVPRIRRLTAPLGAPAPVAERQPG
ncbi:hypothetical protein Athai_32250 [Actinocatenispora thailandica]|uniref:MFS transporter n=1 Tax=Actinocatenispora thailandica TaxID=227318 RepID=A0A7R7HX20_9ACTN|nr:MFS transporter [Actinocatenispora thailandica]BCJ35722.1 hypothetical protein Athai_32250 [Actinocatenispora thailandica]